MEINVEVKQEFLNGVAGAKRYNIRVFQEIPYPFGGGSRLKSDYLYDYSEAEIREFAKVFPEKIAEVLKI